jgi:SAM-dependent methyltransferase
VPEEAEREGPLLAIDTPMVELIAGLRRRLAAGERVLRVLALDPDLGRGCYPGERVMVAGREPLRGLHRSWRVWLDLAGRLGLRMATPRRVDAATLELRLERLDERARWQAAEDVPASERYGRDSGYARISKLEDPDLVIDLDDALTRAGLPAAPRILELGVNRGDSLALIVALRPALVDAAEFVGVDHSASALALARERFAGPRRRFIAADVNALASLELGEFDLVLAMGTLQSPGVDDRALLRQIVQRQLAPTGALIVGVPNCRYLDGELLHGARQKNYSQPELGLVIKDIAFYRRYLQQHRRTVHVTGKHYLLVTAVA